MKHVVTLNRAGVEALAKATGGGGGHKYRKRERVFRNGKLAWRYWYDDDDQRTKHRDELEDQHPGELVEQHLITDLSLVYDSHQNELPPTSMWTPERISQLLFSRPKVKISAAFRRKHLQQHLDSEEHGRAPERNVLQRITKALSMLPERIQKLVDVESIKIVDSKDRTLKAREKITGRPVPACFMEKTTAGGTQLVFVSDEGASGINSAPHGEPHFGSALTMTEERVWHQIAKVILERARKDRKLLRLLGGYRDIVKSASSPDEPVSAYARRRWEDDFAESLACLLSHPKQLAEQCPDRFNWLMENGFGNANLPKEADALLDAPVTDFAWYETKKKTRTKKILDKLKEEAPTDLPFRSEKDQFYSITVDGRTIFFRIGPTDAASEPGWDRMPDTIDRATGLPVHDSAVSNAFRGMEQYKEIYDEHGNRLDPVSAFFFLMQGQIDEKWEKKLPEDLPSDPAKLRQMALSSKRDWHLGRKIFNSTGENRAHTSAQREKEKKAVKKYIEQGKIDEKRGDRWAWVPHPISKEEFHAKTPTFAFEGLREAAEQPHVIPGQMDHDASGKLVPKLWAKVYELLTIDGTSIRMTVQESAAFEANQELLAPVIVEEKDPETGEVERRIEWRKVVAKIAPPGTDPGYDQDTGTLHVLSLDPKDISKLLNVSQQELLKRNGKFRQHQLHDPVLAALINPTNRPIRTSADLLKLVREAARAGNEAWVSIYVDDEVPPHSVHAKVRFDGGGSPLLLGDYWKRKLGMENPRVSDLIKGKRLKIAKPKQRPVRRPKIKLGDTVRFTIKGKEFFGKLISRSLEGKRKYVIAPLPGQESPPGWDRMPETITVGRALSVPTDRDPERPWVVLREYVAPDTDLLLYADELISQQVERQMGKRKVRARAIVPGSGVVKIALPKDGSWTFEEIARAPGVTATEKGELILDVRMMDKFREHVGAFIMDDHTQRKLRVLMEMSKSEGGAKPHRIGVHEIADPLNGNRAATDGLLKGCRPTIHGNPFRLGKHQVELLQAMADNDGRILAAHFMGTGKTVSAIAAIKMMQNMTDDDGKPHPNRPKRVIVIVPKGTAANWQQEVASFTFGKATIVGSSTTPNAQQMFKLPDKLRRKMVMGRGGKQLETWEAFFKRIGMSQQEYEAEVERLRLEAVKENPRLWRPDEDDSDIIIVPQEYFTIHGDELKRIGGFDGMVVDEAHGIQRKNRRSEQILDHWNQDMKMMMLLTGTPITNRLNTLPRYIELLSKGDVLLGGEGTDKEKQENFEDWAMTESAVLKEAGVSSSAKMDLNPQAVARLMKLIRPFIHVATSGDVVDKTMPAVLLDENSPTPQGPIQASLYRGYMDELTEQDKKLFELSATLGEDEKIMSEEARKSVLAARMIANTLAYKKPDGREYITITIPDTAALKRKIREVRRDARERDRDPDAAADKIDPAKFKKKVEFRLPTLDKLMKIGRGFWPDMAQLQGLLPHPEQQTEFKKWLGYMLGKDYETQLQGKSITTTTSAEERKAMKKGEPLNGTALGKKVPNPDYGPEGIICRGVYDKKTQSAKAIRHKIRDASGKVVDEIVVPVGLRFIRDPRKKSAGFYFIAGLPVDHPLRAAFSSDWDFSKAVVDEAGEGTVKGAEKGQRPKEGHESFDVQRHPGRRRERLMFDLAMTTGNAKTDEMQRYIERKLDPQLGGDPDKQMIIFAEAIGSGVRCIESKLRMLGYVDVNEALSGALQGDEVLVPPNGKYFVTFMGTEGTLGDREINSEIFRKRKNADGSDSEMSMFVHRTLHGTSSKLKPGEILEGWPRKQRQIIAKLFDGVKPPTRVMQDSETGQFRYFYEEDLKPSQRKRFHELEAAALRASGAKQKEAQQKIRAFLEQHWTDQPPLTERQIRVLNNCQFMVASDAAQVGMNWGNATDLIMFDSLFSPMEEWQRITRAARMLPPAVREKFKKHFAKLGAVIDQMESETGLSEFDGDVDAAMSIVMAGLDRLPTVREDLMQSGMNPEATAEAFLAQRALDRIRQLRPQIEQKLRTQGRTISAAPKIPAATTESGGGGVELVPGAEPKTQTISKHEITSADVMNEILEGKDPTGKPYLTQFEKTILRSRKYLVDVKRLTTSVEAPVREEKTRKVRNPETGRMNTVKTEHIIGYQTEFPSKAEKSKLTQARAKQIPFEALLSDLQTEFPVHTSYDFESATPGQMAKFEPASPKSKEELAAMEARRAESKKFYGKDKSGLTRRQREQLERKRIAKERREREKAQKAALKKKRAAESRARAAARKKKRVKKSLPLGYIL